MKTSYKTKGIACGQVCIGTGEDATRGSRAGRFAHADGAPMRFKIVEQQPKTYVIILSTGEELASGLKKFASDQKLGDSSFQAIGAFSSVKLGWFDWAAKQYRPSVTLDEQVELVSLIGDIALADDRPQVHAHVVIAKRDGTAHGGHLMEAHVRPTCEVVLTENPEKLHKKLDPESGLALINP